MRQKIDFHPYTFIQIPLSQSNIDLSLVILLSPPTPPRPPISYTELFHVNEFIIGRATELLHNSLIKLP